MLNISETLRDRHFNGILIGTYTRPAEGCHFEWPSPCGLELLINIQRHNFICVARSLCDSWATCLILV